MANKRNNHALRNQKDTLYRKVFSEKENILSLYNALNDSHYENAEDIEVVTLENVVYMNMKNDMAFILNLSLNMYEQQSTYCPNMPLRNLFYVSKELEGITRNDNLYGTKLIKIPTPTFVVLYNGTQKQPEKQILKLSDMFHNKSGKPELELAVTVYNINPSYNQELLNKCSVLKEYMTYVEKVRNNIATEKMEIEQAVEEAIKYCVKEDILADFLSKYRREAKDVSITEYNHERTMQMIREECLEEGISQGISQGKTEMLIKMLKKVVEVPTELEQQIREESNEDKINKCADAIMLEPGEIINEIDRILNE